MGDGRTLAPGDKGVYGGERPRGDSLEGARGGHTRPCALSDKAGFLLDSLLLPGPEPGRTSDFCLDAGVSLGERVDCRAPLSGELVDG